MRRQKKKRQTEKKAVYIPTPQFNHHSSIGDPGRNLDGMLLQQLDFVIGQIIFVQIRDLAAIISRDEASKGGET